MTRSIITSVNAGVATLTLSQPEIRNAFSDVVIAEITAAFAEVGQRDDVRAVVLAAEGPAFCAGANLNWMRAMADYTREENLADAGKLAAMLHTIATCPHPTIARVQGDVYAGGMGLVAACDMAVAVQEAHFCLSEVKIGLIPATIGPYVLARMGEDKARRVFMSARLFDAEEADERIQLVRQTDRHRDGCGRHIVALPHRLVMIADGVGHDVGQAFGTGVIAAHDAL